MSPESINFRRFTTASDVWMFGELSFRRMWKRVPILTSVTRPRGGAESRGWAPTAGLPGSVWLRPLGSVRSERPVVGWGDMSGGPAGECWLIFLGEVPELSVSYTTQPQGLVWGYHGGILKGKLWFVLRRRCRERRGQRLVTDSPLQSTQPRR